MCAIGLLGCSVEQIEASSKIFEKLAEELNKQKPEKPISATPIPEIAVSPTPTPETTKLPVSEVQKPECGRKNPQDGFKRGFTYKPNSDTQKWATAVFPPYITDEECIFAGLKARNKGTIGGDNGTELRAVHILDGWTGQRLKETHGAIKIRCGCYFWSIPNPSVRVD